MNSHVYPNHFQAFALRLAPFQHRIVHSVYRPGLSTYCQTDVSDVVAVVKSPQGNCMFAGASNRKVQRITLALAVGNSIVRKHLVPRTTIKADIGPLDPAGSVLDLKIYSHAIRGDLGSGQSPHYRRGIIDIYRLAGPLS